MSKVGKIERILIFRLSSIGDIILTSALIRCLRNTYPLAQIDFVVKSQFVQLVESNPNISTVYGFESKKGFSELKRLRNQLVENNYDVFLDIHKNYRSLFFRSAFKNAVVLKYKKNIFKRTLLVSFGINRYKNELPVYRRFIEAAKSIGVEYDGRKTDFFVPDNAKQSFSAIALAKQFNVSKQYVAIMCGASFENKKWPKENFKVLVQRLTDINIPVVLVGGKSEIQDTEFIAEGFSETDVFNFTGVLDLLQTAALLKSATLTVSNDTGMLHLSEALGVPVVGIYRYNG
ncbi:MAG: glycosyltransferase family 9 protein [Bacteroidales bacterium]|nr:glycosyltransferase family 9 protein [Bacteroidales bacterium]